MHLSWRASVGGMSLVALVLVQGCTQAGNVKPSTQDTSPAPRATSGSGLETARRGTVEVVVNEGRGGTRLYRYDRSTGKLTLVRTLSAQEAPSYTARFQDLRLVASQVALYNPNEGGAVAPEGTPRPPKGGPPGGTNPDIMVRQDLDEIKLELSALKVDLAQVKVGPLQ